jgi:hypothetical protein
MDLLAGDRIVLGANLGHRGVGFGIDHRVHKRFAQRRQLAAVVA